MMIRHYLKAGARAVKLLAMVAVTAFTILPGSKANAAEWVEITRNAPGTVVYYLDEESIRREGDKITFWDKRVVSDDPDFKEIRGHNEIDCGATSYRTLRITGFDRKGSSFTDQEPGQWQHIDGNSAMAVFQSRLCR
jgi:hypothetical protein